MKRLGQELIPSVMAGETIFLLISGHRVAFRARDRLLVCPVCGNLSQPPSRFCYGCETGHPLVDPIGNAAGVSKR